MNDFLEINLPWWLNNLIRAIARMPFIPVFLLWLAIKELWGSVEVIFSGGAAVLSWPWEWDWVEDE